MHNFVKVYLQAWKYASTKIINDNVDNSNVNNIVMPQLSYYQQLFLYLSNYGRPHLL